MAISKAVRSGKVTETSKGINPDDPLNRSYIQADHAVMKRAKASGEKDLRAAESKRRLKLNFQKLEADIRLKNEQSDVHAQSRARILGLLIEREVVDRMHAALGAELKLRLLDMPRRISAGLFSLARQDGATPMAIEGALNKEMADALRAVKEAACRAGIRNVG